VAVGQAQPLAQPPAQAPLAGQLSGPLFSLAGGKPGEHTMTINVTPDNLGPVTVRAHISAGDVRLELFAPNDAGREALRSILPDLKRDLAGTGLIANLDLSSGNQPGPQSGQQGNPLGDPGGQGSRNSPVPSGGSNPDAQRRPATGPAPGARSPRSADSTLDVLA
jgi:flagellar hook-length control protein FliK